LGRAHFGAGRELAFGEAVAAGFCGLRRRAGGVGAAPAEGALVHLAAGAQSAPFRGLRGAGRGALEDEAPADADVLVVQDHAFLSAVEAIDGAHRHARRVGAMHARHRHGALARYTIVDRHDAPTVHPPGDVVLLLAGGDAAVALDAALGVTQ